MKTADYTGATPPNLVRRVRGRSDIRCDSCGCGDGVVITAPIGAARLRHRCVVYCAGHDATSPAPDAA